MTNKRSILLAVDLTVDLADLSPALDLASDANRSVHLIYCPEPEPAFVGYIETGTKDELQDRLDTMQISRERLEQVAAALTELGIDTHVHLIPGPVVETVLTCAEEVDAQLIAVVGHKHNVAHRLLLGSVVSSLLKASHRPVLVLPPSTSLTGDENLALTAVDRLLEIVSRPGLDEAAELSAAAVEYRDAAESGTDNNESNRLLEALHRFETDHVTLTRAINDVAYYLSGLGI